MNYILFDPPVSSMLYSHRKANTCLTNFLPFMFTRPLAEMRVFGGTIKEIWENYLGCKVSYFSHAHLADLYPIFLHNQEINVFIPSYYLPNPNVKRNSGKTHYIRNGHDQVMGTYTDENAIFYNTTNKVLGYTSKSKTHGDMPSFSNDGKFFNVDNICLNQKKFSEMNKEEKSQDFREMEASGLRKNLSEAFDLAFSKIEKEKNPKFIKLDLSHMLDNMINFSEHKVSNIDCSQSPFLNDDDGPIIIEEDVTIMEGAMIRGPVHICKGSVIKMGAKIYGPTIIGPYCKISGEVSNSIFLGYSNKAHDGFLGHSIIGEWCNIGAGTSNSNLKNNYETVKMWDYWDKKFKDSEKQFLGLYMGDHTKCAINTSFNTGTTVGVNCNIFGSGFPRNYISSFSWGGTSGYKDYDIEKALQTAKIVMKRRGVKMSSEYEKMLREVFSMTASFRN